MWVTVHTHLSVDIQVRDGADIDDDCVGYRINKKRFKDQRFETIADSIEAIETA
ncbi:hypothetical protein [Paenibacillus eucommiae]|uniref:Uncharacterized protein n=1 Tax=Paenibacillus eucommiae TaxID=1355755 RepID=A0ABS4J8A3_9BACL|nr:hypothetical protein [Paenibacillus eucommiae]MBP1995485.1 hypothetical protein [Paenibacillus eucommiae]